MPPNGLALAQSPTTYEVDILDTGTAATTYDLSVAGLPAGVTASFNQSTVTLQPGQTLGGANEVTLSLSETGATLVAASFTVTATAVGAPNVTLSTPGTLALQTESFVVATVATTPPYVQPGTPAAVSATLQVAVNESRSLAARYTVTDTNGNVVFTSTAVAVPVTAATSVVPVNLGSFPTTGLADGVYTITVTVTDTSAQPLPAASGRGSLTIGLPVSASFAVSPTTLPSGGGTVTDTSRSIPDRRCPTR